MHEILIASAVASAVALGAMSPGPSFVMVARIAVSRSRQQALAAAIGMGVGGSVFAAAALLGLQALLTAVPWLYLGLKLAGGAYLMLMAYRIWSAAPDSLSVVTETPLAQGSQVGSMRRAFVLGLGTQLSNPKTAIVIASIFASLVPQQASSRLLIALPFLVFAIEVLWYSTVALLLSAVAPREAYLRYKTGLDRVASSVMALLGLRLILSAGKI
ncbi:LysE family transporter [Undibacterium sp.]|uniref:LysE family translocator n=1 Tax=Undibacterium sp. TaxID=1914977 RepID=UPI0025ED398B|nr:LysE family transporter [Undibacterium sp.]